MSDSLLPGQSTAGLSAASSVLGPSVTQSPSVPLSAAPPVLPPVPPSLFVPTPVMKPPSPKQQSVGAIISIIIIVLMIIIGAFYAWGKRIAEERALIEAATSTSVTY